MKKLASFALFLILITSMFFTGCDCSCSNESSSGPQTHVYNTFDDYSGVQGYKNWYYLAGEDDLSTAEYMVFDTYFYAWRTALDMNCLAEKMIVHPGQLVQSIRAWKAPYDGTVKIESKVQRRPVGYGGDGCYLYISLGYEDTISSLVLSTDDLDMIDFNADSEIDVKKGDMLYFVMNCSGNYTFDQTYWNVTITHNYTL